MSAMKRRAFLSLSTLAAGGACLATRLAFANVSARKPRFVLVIMRGALDGIAAVPPYADPDYTGLWREVALQPPGASGGALPLNGFFGLHPALGFLQQSYTARELIVFHALASPYRERSHFDGQDVLENGSPKAPWPAKRLAEPCAHRACPGTRRAPRAPAWHSGRTCRSLGMRGRGWKSPRGRPRS